MKNLKVKTDGLAFQRKYTTSDHDTETSSGLAKRHNLNLKTTIHGSSFRQTLFPAGKTKSSFYKTDGISPGAFAKTFYNPRGDEGTIQNFLLY